MPHPDETRAHPEDAAASAPEIEALLGRDAAALAPPRELIERVYRASVAGLPGKAPARAAAPPRRPAIAGRLRTRSPWAWVSLAAAIGLAFVVAHRFVPVPRGGPLSADEVWVLLQYGSSGFDAESETRPGIPDLLLAFEMSVGDVAAELTMVAEPGWSVPE